MASPCLATAGASLGDIWTMAEFPFAVALWAAVATLGPALGPTLSSYAVKDLGWRFSSWELLIIAGPVYLAILLVLPESSGPTILYYKAKRMREDTGNQELMSASERKQRDMKVSSLLFDALVKPWEINALDPAILFTTVYMGLCYGIYYSFFELLQRQCEVCLSSQRVCRAVVFDKDRRTPAHDLRQHPPRVCKSPPGLVPIAQLTSVPGLLAARIILVKNSPRQASVQYVRILTPAYSPGSLRRCARLEVASSQDLHTHDNGASALQMSQSTTSLCLTTHVVLRFR
ncbi:hypothetical protein IG631_05756 [Alternaria alternata]|nr:hypothetical protein IG631_05756 [Alternaria alternata]